MKKLFAQNRKASFEYFISDKYEAGIALVGTEVKSIRSGGVNIEDAFIGEFKGELCLLNAHIPKYQKALDNHAETRPRKLLLHTKEIQKISGAVSKTGYTCVPLKIYLNDKNIIKLEIAIGMGKKQYDKRETIKQRDWQKEQGQLLRSK